MAISAGTKVQDPRQNQQERTGKVILVRKNPACLMRTLVIQWNDKSIEELEEIMFGPLED